MKFAILCVSASTSILFSHDGSGHKAIRDLVYEAFHLSTSAITLPFSGLYQEVVDGDKFTFHRIGIGPREPEKIYAIVAKNGEFIEIADGRRTPLVIGSMPREQWHLNRLKSVFKLKSEDRVELHTLNRPYELRHTGAARLFTQDPSLRIHLYPTTDDCAPSMVNLLRIVKSLRERDTSGAKLAYVHCLAGRGRSATAIAAYLYTILQDAGIHLPAVDVMERYVRSQRTQIAFRPLQRTLLQKFRRMLNKSKVGDLFISYEALMKEQESKSAFEQEVLKSARHSIYTIFLSQVGFTMFILALFVSSFS